LTGQLAAQLQPPANPYANGAPVAASAATIFGPTGQFTIRAGAELRIGRDPAQCGIFLQEPRISGVHATLRFEGGQLWVRDESSNNGTYLDGARIAAAAWTPVAPGSQLRFGPIDFTVRLDA
jgi:pSer/pThr/pTyr-binding forkhead associated (FHA) protein